MPFQWVSDMSSSSTNPQLMVPSPPPFCPSSNSSRRRKLRGTTARRKAGLGCATYIHPHQPVFICVVGVASHCQYYVSLLLAEMRDVCLYPAAPPTGVWELLTPNLVAKSHIRSIRTARLAYEAPPSAIVISRARGIASDYGCKWRWLAAIKRGIGGWKKGGQDRDGIHEAWWMNRFEYADIPNPITQSLLLLPGVLLL